MTYTWRDEDERLIDDADEKREYIKQWLPHLPPVGVKMADNDTEFLTVIISAVCTYAVENGMEPDDTIKTVAENMLALLEISTFNNWMAPPKENDHG